MLFRNNPFPQRGKLMVVVEGGGDVGGGIGGGGVSK